MTTIRPDHRPATDRRAELVALLDRFMAAWARHDLEAAMACMAEDCRYDEFNAKVWEGKAAVREGFLPQFRGDYGDIQFLEEDRFIDPEAGRMLVRWLCRFEWKGSERRWRGLDILHVRDGLITEKLTYAKTERPLAAGGNEQSAIGNGKAGSLPGALVSRLLIAPLTRLRSSPERTGPATGLRRGIRGR